MINMLLDDNYALFIKSKLLILTHISKIFRQSFKKSGKHQILVQCNEDDDQNHFNSLGKLRKFIS